MACFGVPLAEAIVMTAVTAVVRAKERKLEPVKPEALSIEGAEHKPLFSRKLKWLTGMLWGGSALLAFEHVWHGEVVPWFPFLTAASDAGEAAVMLNEMATVGVAMTAVVTAAWGVMLLVSHIIEKRAQAPQPAAE